MPKPSLEKAAAFAEVSKRTGGILVFATRDSTLLHQENASAEIAKYTFSEYSCVDCSSHFHAVKAEGLQPYCVTCGSGEVAATKVSKPKVPADSQMAYLTCSSCGTNNVFHQALASAGDSIHCSACGTGMKTKANFDEQPVDTLIEADDMELLDVDDTVGEELSDTTMDANDTDAEPLSGTDPVNPVTTTQGLPSDSPAPELDADPVAPNTSLQDPIEQTQVVSEVDGEEVVVDLVDEMDEEVSPELSFVYIGSSMSIVGKQQIVATLTEERAGRNADMLQTEQFRRAVAHSIQTLGLKKALAQYGFEHNKLKVVLAKTLSNKVQAKVEQRTAELSNAQKTVLEDVQQSLDIAAAGYANNFWRDRTDPLKLALAAELRAVGVKNSTQFVDRVFASHGVAHLREVIELARELIKKPVEARNALAQAIDLTKYQPMLTKADADSVSDDEDADDVEDEETQLASFATPVVETAFASTTKPRKGHSEIAQILGGDKLPFAL